MNKGVTFEFHGASLTALRSGALWWRDENLLVVSDLHLGKSDRIARRTGTLVPPYETQDTLLRLQFDIDATNAGHVICLGDSFDDMAASANLPPEHRNWILTLQAGRDWTWIEGNHDPAPLELGGQHRAHLAMGPLVFRHIASATADAGEISGHYHPKLRLPIKGRMISRACFIYDACRLILPAYGTYTGGLDVLNPVLQDIMQSDAHMILIGQETHVMPMPRARTV